MVALNMTLNTAPAIYNLTRVELRTFTFSSRTQSLSIDNAVIGRIPKRLLFTMLANKDFVGSMDTNPYMLQHFGLRNFAMFVNDKQIPGEGLTLDTGHEKTTVMGYKTLFEGSGIHHSNSGLQITHDMYINGYFMLLYDLTPDMAASEGHASLAENGHIRIECNFGKALTESITCLLYPEYDNLIRIDSLRNVTTDLKNVHKSNFVYLKKCAIFYGRLSVGSVASFYHTAWHHHSKYRRAHADGITLASHPSRTQILIGILL